MKITINEQSLIEACALLESLIESGAARGWMTLREAEKKRILPKVTLHRIRNGKLPGLRNLARLGIAFGFDVELHLVSRHGEPDPAMLAELQRELERIRRRRKEKKEAVAVE